MSRWISLSLLALLCTGSSAQPYGRFLWAKAPEFPGWKFSDLGLQSDFPGSTRLEYSGFIRKWTSAVTDGVSATFTSASHDLAPTKARCNLADLGPELYFERSFQLSLQHPKGLILSWADGSVEEGVPSAPSTWVTVSFRGSEPPILLTFSRPVSLQIEKKGKEHRLVSVGEPYQGWVRVALPLGVRALTTDRAADLGVLVGTIKEAETVWSTPGAKFQGISVSKEPGILRAELKFDQAGAVIPPAFLNALSSRYGVKLESRTLWLRAPTQDGPAAVSLDESIRLRLPFAPVPAGRAVVVSGNGGPATHMLERAFRLLRADCTSPTADSLRIGLKAFLSEAKSSRSPFFGTPMLWSPEDQKSVRQNAEWALASQLLDRSKAPALMEGFLWAQDFRTGRVDGMDSVSMSLLALACAFSEKTDVQFRGAMLAAGLATQSGPVALPGVVSSLYPMKGVRSTLVDAWRSPVRMVSGPPLRASGDTLRYGAESTGKATLQLLLPEGSELQPSKNVLEFSQEGVKYGISPVKPGEVLLRILGANIPKVPSWKYHEGLLPQGPG